MDEAKTEQDLDLLKVEIDKATNELKAAMLAHENATAELSEKAATDHREELARVEKRLGELAEKQAQEVAAVKQQLEERGIDTEDLTKTHADLAAAVKELQAKAGRPRYGAGAAETAAIGRRGSFADMALADDAFIKAVQTKGRSQAGVFASIDLDMAERKETLLTTAPTGPARWEPPVRWPTIAPPARPLTIRGLIPSVITPTRQIEYLKLTTAGGATPTPGTVNFDAGAGFVPEGDALAESSYRWTLVEDGVKRLGTFVTVSDTALDSIDMLRMDLDRLQTLALSLVEESQVVNGNGVGENLAGILPAAGTTLTWSTYPTGTTQLDLIRKAITASTVLFFTPSAVILNPADAEALDLGKGTDAHYIFGVGGPSGTGPTVWRLPILVTTVIPAGTGLVGDFANAARIMDWQRVRIDVTNSHNGNFIQNLVVIRAVEHVGLEIFFDNAFVELNFDAPPA
jgi:hypothetical protein